MGDAVLMGQKPTKSLFDKAGAQGYYYKGLICIENTMSFFWRNIQLISIETNPKTEGRSLQRWQSCDRRE